MGKRSSVLGLVILGAFGGLGCHEQSLVVTLDPDARLLSTSLATMQPNKKTPLKSRRQRRHLHLRSHLLRTDRPTLFEQPTYALTSGTIRLHSDPAQATLVGEATYTITAHQPTDQVQFLLDVPPDGGGGALPVEGLDPAADFVWSKGTLTITPSSPLQAEQHWTVTIRWRIQSLDYEVGDFPEGGGTIKAAQVSEETTYFTWGYNYFPKIRNQELPLGLRFEITHPQDYGSVLSAQWVSATAAGDQETEIWQLNRSQAIVTLAIAQYKTTQQAQCGDQTVEIYAIDQQDSDFDIKPEIYTSIIARYCDDYISRFGQPSQTTIRFCGVSDDFVSGYSAPGMILVPNYTWDDDGSGSFDTRDFFLAHELAHQWWGNDVWASGTDVWLIEGMADYLACSAMENMQGRETGLGIWLWEVKELFRYLAALQASGDNEPPILTDDLSNYAPQLYYIKGAWVLRMLEDRLGKQAMQEVLNTFRLDHPFTQATTAEFISLAQQNTPEDLQPFFEQWLQGTGMLDLTHQTSSDNAGIQIEIQQNQPWSADPNRYFETPLTIQLRLGSQKRQDRVQLEAKAATGFALDPL